MKKILTILAILMMGVCPQSSLADDEVQWTEVSTAQEFYTTIRNNHAANVRLTADIDLSSHSASGDCIFDFEFKGKINGKYINAEGKDACYSLKNSKKDLLFNYLTNAEISDIAIVDCSFDAWDTHSGWIGTSATGCTFRNIILSNVDCNGMQSGSEHDRAGGLIGEAVNTTFEKILAMDVDIEIDGYMAGCIAGKATGCRFSNCLTNLLCSVYADGNEEDGILTNTSAYNGGIVGYALNSNISRCVNMAFIGSNDDRAGGILGFGKGTTVIDCTNYGVVAHMRHNDFGKTRTNLEKDLENVYKSSETGDCILGLSTAGVSAAVIVSFYKYYMWNTFEICLKLSAAYAKIAIVSAVVSAIAIPLEVLLVYYAQDPDEIGGIAGHMQEGSSLIGCSNGGYVFGADAHVGGIVGYLKGSSVADCWNRNYVKGNEQTGGIVGTNDNGSITSCLNTSYAKAGKEASESISIQGDTKGTVKLKGNCYISWQDDTDTKARAVSWKSLNSGSVAAYMNSNTSQNDKRWTQTIGTDLYPSPTAFSLDTTAIADANVMPNINLAMEVSTTGEFFNAINNPCVHVNLLHDIDLKKTSVRLYPRGTTFYGVIQGNGHTLKNAEIEIEDEDKINSLNGALFAQASHATFENLTIDSVYITQDNTFAANAHTEAILVATSNNCKYDNVHIKNSSIQCEEEDDDFSWLSEVGGIVAISTSDTITDCSMESTCKLQGYSGVKNTDTNVGGIASKAYKSVFRRCHNAASIWADDNQEGGIVAYAENCIIEKCLNTGSITAQENVGGICGNAVNTVITQCVNTGLIDDDHHTREDKRSGIVGVLNGSKATVSHCLNFGSVNYADDDCSPINNKRIDGATYGEGNYYYCQFNGTHTDNTEKTDTAKYEKMVSGEFAYRTDWLYQSIDNNAFTLSLPVPLPQAGAIYPNTLCDGTQSYSNRYKSTAAHETVNDNGYCSVCGDWATLPGIVHVSDGVDLNTVARFVNSGKDYSSAVIYIDQDIDMNGFAYTPIGTADHPFHGYVYGENHRIKNLEFNANSDGAGLFGTVGSCWLFNIIMDSSCTINSSHNGTAGIVGCVKSTSGSECSVNIYNCGNEGLISVSSPGKNGAGIVGAVYDNNATVVNINNCYNTGSILGYSESECAAIIGYARLHTNIRNTWNSGTITGHKDYYTFAGTWETTSGRGQFDGTIDNCYNVYNPNNDKETTKSGVISISTDQFKLGYLCQKLNSYINKKVYYKYWTQNLETDNAPYYGDGGLHYSRSMSNQWGTVCLPYAIESGDDYDLYTIKDAQSSTLTLEKVTGTHPAGTPAIIRRNGDVTEVSIPASTTDNGFETSPKAGANGLTGKFVTTDITNETGFVIANNTFWSIEAIRDTDKISCDAYHAYISGTLSEAKKLTLTIDDEATGISQLQDSEFKIQNTGKFLENGRVIITNNNKKYNLNGQEIK